MNSVPTEKASESCSECLLRDAFSKEASDGDVTFSNSDVYLNTIVENNGGRFIPSNPNLLLNALR
ncbi:MAG: hypothetical protein LBH93_01710 [Chitinispirillales bacterium]|jgi:hypothetical protein|nr:hypothetical protein [Chitinispirillales bacterium]